MKEVGSLTGLRYVQTASGQQHFEPKLLIGCSAGSSFDGALLHYSKWTPHPCLDKSPSPPVSGLSYRLVQGGESVSATIFFIDAETIPEKMSRA